MFKLKSLVTVTVFLGLSILFAFGIRIGYTAIVDWRAEQIPHYKPILNYKSLLQKMSAKSFVEILQANQTIEIINFKIRANLTLCKKQLIPKA